MGLQRGFSEHTIAVIASCNVVRDLGIQVDSHLKFHEHTTAVTKKANQLLSIIHKVLTKLHLPTYTKLIFDPCWSMEIPLFVFDQQQVEVQKKLPDRYMHDLRNHANDSRLIE